MDIKTAKQNAKRGWMLNPDEKVVNGVIKGINRCQGKCPCANDSTEKTCPCSNYREEYHCCCRLYVSNLDYVTIANEELGKNVYVGDKSQIIRIDLFGSPVVINKTDETPVRLATQEDFDRAFID